MLNCDHYPRPPADAPYENSELLLPQSSDEDQSRCFAVYASLLPDIMLL